MSKTAFTPGPWFVETDFFVYGGDGKKIKGEYFDGVELPLVCYAWSDRRDRTENKANAALIAAAPEMYEAIRKIVRYECENCRLKQMRCDCRFQELADVLKKARGEE